VLGLHVLLAADAIYAYLYIPTEKEPSSVAAFRAVLALINVSKEREQRHATEAVLQPSGELNC
jgi:hypothetical protein